MLSRNRFVGISLTAVSAVLLSIALNGEPAVARKNTPIVSLVPSTGNPPVPAGLKVTCLLGPNVLMPSKTCPVIKYQGITTWAYSFIDNRVSMALVSYDAHNNVVGNVTKDGARYVWQATVNPVTQTVTFSGQSSQIVTAGWGELALAPPTAASGPALSDTNAAQQIVSDSTPQIVVVPSNANPPVPAGLKVTCLLGPNVLASSKTCPVIKYQGITTWAYSFIDNRVSFALVSYDAKGNVVRNVTMDGARYVWQMTADPASQMVTVSGQSNQVVNASWTQLGP